MIAGRSSRPGAFRSAQHRGKAEDIAVAAFQFLASDTERLGRFLQVTGIPIESIRKTAQGSDFLAGVLDHVVSDEQLLLAFARHAGIEPNGIMQAHGILAGEWERDLP
jgi:hypothetical protein